MDEVELYEHMVALAQKVSSIEDKVDFILRELKLEYHDKSDWFQPEDEIKKLIVAGRKIEAIKAYREKHKVGLADAKTAVERIELGLIK